MNPFAEYDLASRLISPAVFHFHPPFTYLLVPAPSRSSPYYPISFPCRNHNLSLCSNYLVLVGNRRVPLPLSLPSLPQPSKQNSDIRRENRPELRKAGNLRWAFARTSGEMMVIFDADFCPRPEFLRETTPYFTDPRIAIVQTPQFFRHREEQTWVEKGAGATQELFYRLVQARRNNCNSMQA